MNVPSGIPSLAATEAGELRDSSERRRRMRISKTIEFCDAGRDFFYHRSCFEGQLWSRVTVRC